MMNDGEATLFLITLIIGVASSFTSYVLMHSTAVAVLVLIIFMILLITYIKQVEGGYYPVYYPGY